MSRKKVLIAAAAVAVLAGLAWAFLPAGEDAQVAKVVELQEKLFGEERQIPPEERRKAFEELRTEADKLTPEQRGQMMRDHPPPFMREMQQNIVAFFDLSEDQRKAELDKRIDEMEQRRREWEKRRAERGAGNGGGLGGRGGGPPGGFGRTTDPKQRNQMRKQMLDNTSPQQRAMFSEYLKQLEQRRKERGLPPMRVIWVALRTD
jgi:hypothetical protein